MNVSRGSKIGLRTIALVYLFVLLVVPIGVILTRTFENGIGPFLESITTPAAISALNLSLIIVAIVVPINVVFGVVTALALVVVGSRAAEFCSRWSTCPSQSRPSSSVCP